MKKNLIKSVTLGVFLFMVIIASAINPVGLLPKTSPPPLDTAQVTISLGGFSCESLGCNYWYVSVYTDGPNGQTNVYSPFVYTGWATYSGPWNLAVDPAADKICVTWHFSGTCSPLLLDKTCCIPYTGSGRYFIICNPCE